MHCMAYSLLASAFWWKSRLCCFVRRVGYAQTDNYLWTQDSLGPDIVCAMGDGSQDLVHTDECQLRAPSEAPQLQQSARVSFKLISIAAVEKQLFSDPSHANLPGTGWLLGQMSSVLHLPCVHVCVESIIAAVACLSLLDKYP